ncbi:hypothetical protein [Nonlabens dokdonensis]|uniref:hypothetical protein n=1 Tax=Nonlabens dokdonensis TaxID=328515 RepID=UPI0026F2F5E5|nr:hypothetical protein [Nonlabens dokdonensis]
MSIEIKIANDERSAQVNGKNVFMDSSGNWLASGEPLTEPEKRSLFNMLKPKRKTSDVKPPLFFCKVKDHKNLAQ